MFSVIIRGVRGSLDKKFGATKDRSSNKQMIWLGATEVLENKIIGGSSNK